MKLAGQGGPNPPRGDLDERGYIMVALLIAMAVTAVWMGAALPSWRQQVIREREAELVFRGEQYARAIVLYRTKNNGNLPPNIDVLVTGHFLRKKYLDPITGKEFLPIGGLGISNGFNNPTNPTPITPGSGRQAGPPQGQQGQQGQVGISGVRSQSNDTSIRVYRNQQTYSQWPFDWNQMAALMGRTTGGANGPGVRGPNGPGGPGGRNGGPNGPGGFGNGPGVGGPGRGVGGPGRGVGGPGGIRGGGGQGPIGAPTGGRGRGPAF